MSAPRELTGPPLDRAIVRRAGATLAELADAAIARHPERAALIADGPVRAEMRISLRAGSRRPG